MLYLSDQQVHGLLQDSSANQQVLAQAFRDAHQEQAAQLSRQRIEAQGVKLSALAAVLPNQGVAGAKVYTTIQGRFTFVIILFSTETGAVLAVMDAEEITKKRTAACSVLMAQYFAKPEPKKLALLGFGVQGQEHFLQLTQAYDFDEIHIVSSQIAKSKINELQQQVQAEIIVITMTEQAVQHADIVVTASRATQPILAGRWLKSGAFVAAIGSSLPTTRELDNEVIKQARTIVVESKQQAFQEAGDLLLSKDLNPINKTQTVSEVLLNDKKGFKEEGVVLYKAVGVALEDIALAGLAYENHMKKTIQVNP